MHEGRIIIPPISEHEAIANAHLFIREEYGTIPSPGEPSLIDGIYKIPIEVNYPRVLMDKITDRPKKVRYMYFKNIGEIKIEAQTGEIIDKPRYSEVKNKIQENFRFVQTSVEKALIKSAASKFSILPFSEHMYSPVIDIIATLLINDKMDIPNEIGRLHEKDREKYLEIIKSLSDIGLLQQTENIIHPNSILVEIERRGDDLHDQLSKALAYYFQQCYDDIQSIHRVVGPHLTISGYIYKQCIEYNDVIPVKYDEIRRLIHRVYREDIKQIKIPRYLIQLNNVGLLEMKTQNGEEVWLANEDVFEEVTAQDQLISPIQKLFIEREAIV